ncbi:MAG: hypothetical protein V7K94_18665 [Nostoc sp.]
MENNAAHYLPTSDRKTQRIKTLDKAIAKNHLASYPLGIWL